MIKTNNLQKVFRTDEVETWALNNVSIEVKEGEGMRQVYVAEHLGVARQSYGR